MRGAASWARNCKLLTEDDLTKAGEPATVVNKLISRDGVVAILGEVASSRSLEAAPIASRTNSDDFALLDHPKSRRPAIIFSAFVSSILFKAR